MKARTLALLVALLPTLLAGRPAAAIDWDWGGSLDNATQITATAASSVVMEQEDKITLWVDLQFSPNLTLAAAGSYTFTLERYFLFDVDFLKAEWTFRPNLRAAAGRFLVSDFTGLLLDHTLDGVQVRWDLPFLSLTGGVGTSALLLKPVSTIVMTAADGADLQDDTAYFAPPRLVETITMRFPELFARQDLIASLVFQQDLRPANQLIAEGEENNPVPGLEGGRLHSFNIGVGLTGPLMASLYYDSFLYFQTGSTLSYVEDAGSGTGFSWQYKPIVAFLGGLGLRYYLERYLSSRAEVRALFASGDADNTALLDGNTAGISTLFMPISRGELAIAFDPQLGNLLVAEASYSLKPLGSLQAELKSLGFFRPSRGGISEPGLDPASESFYLGTELQGNLRYRPFSDLGMTLSVGAFLPNAAAFAAAAESTRISGRFELSISF